MRLYPVRGLRVSPELLIRLVKIARLVYTADRSRPDPNRRRCLGRADYPPGGYLLPARQERKAGRNGAPVNLRRRPRLKDLWRLPFMQFRYGAAN